MDGKALPDSAAVGSSSGLTTHEREKVRVEPVGMREHEPMRRSFINNESAASDQFCGSSSRTVERGHISIALNDDSRCSQFSKLLAEVGLAFRPVEVDDSFEGALLADADGPLEHCVWSLGKEEGAGVGGQPTWEIVTKVCAHLFLDGFVDAFGVVRGLPRKGQRRSDERATGDAISAMSGQIAGNYAATGRVTTSVTPRRLSCSTTMARSSLSVSNS